MELLANGSGVSVCFCPWSENGVVEVEPANPQDASVFKDAGEAGASEECDRDS